MKIAVLAWGSLKWDPRDLKISGKFELTGPKLPIEFSRVSGKKTGKLRLTLVIDETNGSPCQTYVAESSCDTLLSARENLRDREGMEHVNGVGFIDRQSGEVSFRAEERHPRSLKMIGDWLETTDFDAVIWTALASNFSDETGEQFSLESAMSFVDQLPVEQQEMAVKYFQEAPETVQTPFRLASAGRWPTAAPDT